MEKERRVKVLSLIALVVAILGLTVAFAALSETLTIKGTAKVDAATWDVHFENPTCEDANLIDVNPEECSSVFKDDGSLYYEQAAGKVNKNPTINGTSIENIDVTITKPDDVVAYYFILTNAGDIDAKIDSVNISKLCESTSSSVESCDWDGNETVSEEDIQKVNDNISFYATMMGENDNILKSGTVLKAGERKMILVMIGYAKINFDGQVEEATELPKRNLTFNDLNVTINFVQAD